ncbi:MAG: hypothetical protein ACREL4_00370 [Gemmatimonadales bacterium]
MRVLGLSTIGLLLLAPVAGAQRVPARQRGALVQRIEDLFVQRVTDELGLSPTQAQQLRGTALRMFARRRAMESESRRLDQLLAGQLRPGVAADPDSVTRLTDSLLVIRVNYARLGQEEMAEMRGYLSPVQSAQYYVLRERLLQRIQNARRMPAAGGADDLAPDPGS